ncbi:MAG: hypothetical protein DRJ40_07285 [Thermoprotei archaeon]|nr:MAG: hypothetical protein DRJ40_07285 [Thermoprotei archaeon]
MYTIKPNGFYLRLVLDALKYCARTERGSIVSIYPKKVAKLNGYSVRACGRYRDDSEVERSLSPAELSIIRYWLDYLWVNGLCSREKTSRDRWNYVFPRENLPKAIKLLEEVLNGEVQD